MSYVIDQKLLKTHLWEGFVNAPQSHQRLRERVVRLRELEERLRVPRAGTRLPLRRASESPIATACLRLVTLRPLLPLFKEPRFILCISRLTSAPAPRE